jgi:L-gulono-1,4-lactone dehydrogenase
LIKRDTGYVAVHHYFKIDHRRYFAAFESIVAEHQGRPHWASCTPSRPISFASSTHAFDHFRQIRDRLDPGRTFDNAYLRSTLGT